MGDSVFDDFEDAMRQMGVRPLDPKAGQKRASPGKLPIVSTSSSTPAPNPQNVAKPPLDQPVDFKHEDLSARIQDLEKEVLRRTVESNELLRNLDALKGENFALQAKQASAKSGRVVRLLQERGFVDRAQQENWLSALVGSGKGHLLLAQFESVNEASFARFLDGCVYLHCGRGDCVGPTHLVPVVVAQDRCELCGGAELVDWAENLSNHLLLAGIRKLYFRSQRLALLRWFSSTLDKRIEVRVAPVDLQLHLGPEVGPVVLWRQGGEASDVPADFRVKAGSLGQMVTRFCYKLNEE